MNSKRTPSDRNVNSLTWVEGPKAEVEGFFGVSTGVAELRTDMSWTAPSRVIATGRPHAARKRMAC